MRPLASTSSGFTSCRMIGRPTVLVSGGLDPTDSANVTASVGLPVYELEVLAHPALSKEHRCLKAGMDAQLPDQVLYVSPSGVRADEHHGGDPLVVSSVREQGEDFAFPPRQPREPTGARLLVVPTSEEVREQPPQHPRRDEDLAPVKRLHAPDEVVKRTLPGEEPPRAGFECCHQDLEVILLRDHEDSAIGGPFSYHRRGMDPVELRELGADHGHIRHRSAALLHPLRTFSRLAPDS